MVFDYLEDTMIDVLPGVALPALVADFIFSRVEWIRGGERGEFKAVAPACWDLHELFTLAFLVARKETCAAGIMVSNLLRPPPTLLPSASLMSGNDNYKKGNPFRRRRKPKQGGSVGLEDALIKVIFVILMFIISSYLFMFCVVKRLYHEVCMTSNVATRKYKLPF